MPARKTGRALIFRVRTFSAFDTGVNGGCFLAGAGSWRYPSSVKPRVFRASWVAALALGLVACRSSDSRNQGPTSTTPSASAAPATPAASVPDVAPSLVFKNLGKVVTTMTLDEIVHKIPPETVVQYDPYYSKEKRYRAVPLAVLLGAAFPNE